MGQIRLFGWLVLFGSSLLIGVFLALAWWNQRLEVRSSTEAVHLFHQATSEVVAPFVSGSKPLSADYSAALYRSGFLLTEIRFYNASTLEIMKHLKFPLNAAGPVEHSGLLNIKLPINRNGNILGQVEYQWFVPSVFSRLIQQLPLLLMVLFGWLVFAGVLSRRIFQSYIDPLHEMERVLNEGSGDQVDGTPVLSRLLTRLRAIAAGIQSSETASDHEQLPGQRAFACMSELVVVVDREGRIVELNPAAEFLTGWARQHSVGKPVEMILDLIQPEQKTRGQHPAQNVLEGTAPLSAPAMYQLISRDGYRHLVQLSVAPLLDTEQVVCGAVLVGQQATDLYEASAKLQRSARLLGKIADATPVMIWSLDANRRFSFANLATRDFFASTGCARWQDFVSHADGEDQPKLNQVLEQLNSQDRHQIQVECRLTDGEGKKVWLYININALRDSQGALLAYVGSGIDISDRKQAESEVERMAFYDSLTGLPNRRLLFDRLERAVITAQRDRVYGAVYFLDLDNFKALNDSMGHAIGDQLLIQVADRIRTTLRAEDTVARFGGDEFVILSGQLEDQKNVAARKARLLGDKISSMLARPYQLNELEYHSTSSIGITLFSRTSDDVEEVLMQADTAMYRAKSEGRNNARFYEPHMQEAIINQMAIEKSLREAVKHQQLALYYQPQFNADGEMIGAEALLRWPQDDGTLMLPLRFLSVAEDSGLIVQIGFWVLETACRQLHEWEQQVLPQGFSLALNISRRQFAQQDFVSRFEEIVKRLQINPEHLQIEFTEKVVKDSMAVSVEKLLDLKKRLRVKISLDDFGTGFSSLTFLRQFPLDQVKIDQAFIRDSCSDPEDGQLIEAILDLCLKMGVEVVAEGVESQQQFDFLQSRGCENFQGYWFGKPVPADQFSFIRCFH